MNNDVYQRITGKRLEVVVAHQQAPNVKCQLFSQAVRQYLPAAPTIQDWCDVNVELDENEMVLRLARGGFLNDLDWPVLRPEDATNIIVVTSPQSLKSQFKSHGSVKHVPTLSRSLHCDKDQLSCKTRNPQACTAKTHDWKADSQRPVWCFPIARIGADECHQYKGATTGFS